MGMRIAGMLSIPSGFNMRFNFDHKFIYCQSVCLVGGPVDVIYDLMNN